MGPHINFKVSAPGKVILMGEHSVVYGKTALAASLSLRTYLSFREIGEAGNMFILELPGINLNHRCKIEKIQTFFKECPPPLLKGKNNSFNLEIPNLIDANLYMSALHTKIAELTVGTKLDRGQECALIAFFFIFFGMLSGTNLEIVPISITVTSDLVVGAGTGSSASYGACLASAFYHYARARVARDNNLGKDVARSGYKPLRINASDLSSFDEKEMSIILSWALVSDQIMHGNPSGIDASVISYGNVIEFRRGLDGKPPFITRLPGTNALKILLVNSGVTRDTKQMVAGVRWLYDRYIKVVNPILTAMDELALAAKEIFKEVQMVQWSLETIISGKIISGKLMPGEIISGVVMGPGKTPARDEGLEAAASGSTGRPRICSLERPDLEATSQESMSCERFDILAAQLGELITMNQHLLCSLGVSHPALDEICSLAAKSGLSAKLTGAGGGGYAIILLPPRLSESRISALQSDLKEHGFDATFALMGGAGVILEKDTIDSKTD